MSTVPTPKEMQRRRAIEEPPAPPVEPNARYLSDFRHGQRPGKQTDPEEVWVCVVPEREESFQAPRASIAAAREEVAKAGWKLTRSEHTGIRDNSWWEVWRPATKADDPAYLADPGEVKGVAGE